MDVERIQKINRLALDLMKQGLAQNREDAVAQAERTFRGDDSGEYSTIREKLQEMKEERSHKESPPKTEQTDALSQDEIKNILKQNTDFFVRKFKEFQEKIATLEREMTSLKTKLTYSRLPTAEQVASSKKEEITVHEAVRPPPLVTEPKQEAQQQSDSSTHPRSGSYTETDVSIEKFFYYGK